MIKILLLLLIVALSAASYVDYDGWIHIKLLHALDSENPDHFTIRGNITVTSSSSGSLSIKQNPLNLKERQQLKALAEANSLYRLKAEVTNEGGDTSTFLTSSRACALVKSYLTEVLWMSLDHSGTVIGITQTISGKPDCSNLNSVSLDDLDKFNTDVFIRHMESAPIPDTASFIQKIEREREARERGEVKDNRGFFAKYWMYIVPVAILVLISGATNPEANGAGGGGGGR